MGNEREENEESSYRESQTPVQSNPDRKKPVEAHVPASSREMTSESTLPNLGIVVSSVLFLFALSLQVAGYNIGIPAVLLALALLILLVTAFSMYRAPDKPPQDEHGEN